jgi:nitronate monooxygenase
VWPKTDLTDLLKVEHPVIQAPMAGSATVALAAAVSNAGGLGSLGYAATPLEEIRANVLALRTATDKPFNLNFFTHSPPQENKEINSRTHDRLKPFYEEVGLAEVPVSAKVPFGTFDADTLSLLMELKPAVTSFHFGLPETKMVAALKNAGCVVLCSATTVAEARILNDAGVDAIIAQGWEAGGHRGGFDTSYEDFGVGTMALVPQVCDAVDVPVIAAGGIADGRGIAAAFALGASGIQMGTAFLSCPEANVSEAHRSAIRNATDQDTRLTRAFSGRPARARNNRYIEAMAGNRTPLPDFPSMYSFSGPLREQSTDNGELDFQFLLYGQAATLNRELPAADLVQTLVKETQEIISNRYTISL